MQRQGDGGVGEVVGIGLADNLEGHAEVGFAQEADLAGNLDTRFDAVIKAIDDGQANRRGILHPRPERAGVVEQPRGGIARQAGWREFGAPEPGSIEAGSLVAQPGRCSKRSAVGMRLT